MGIETALASTIGLALFQAGAPIALVNAGVFVGSNAIALGLSAASVGFQLAAARQGGVRPLTPEAQGVQQLIRQAIPSQRLVFGEVETSGALFFAASEPPYTWYGILLAAHEVEGLRSIRINTTEVTIGDDGFATSFPFADGANKYIEASFRNGSMDQEIDPIIARDFTDMPDTFRQRGHATVVLKRVHGFGANVAAKNEDFKRVWGDSGQFNPLIRFRGAKIYDPRKPGHVIDDVSTHTWSDNAALTLAHALTFRWPDRRIFAPDRLNWDGFARAADECDKWEIDRNGNTFRRYTANGVVLSTDRIYDMIESFRSAMGGDIALERGKIYPVPGMARQPSATLHNAMLVGGFRFSREREFGQLVNIVKTQFQAPDREYQTVEGPVIRDTDAITADGDRYETTISLPFTQGDPRTQRLGHMALKQARAPRSLEIGVNSEAEAWEIGKVYRVELVGGVLEKVNGLYTLAAKTPSPGLRGYQLALAEYDPDAFDFGAADEQPFELDPDVKEAA
jgi:hypothetical protein